MNLFVVSVALRNADGHLLIVRKAGTSTFMLPGGKVEPGETHLQAAVREVAEEVGLVLDPERVTLLGRFSADAANEPGWTITSDVFTSPFCGGPAASGEIEEIRWLPLAEATADAPVPLAPLIVEHVAPALCASGAGPAALGVRDLVAHGLRAAEAGTVSATPDAAMLAFVRKMREDFTRFMMEYQFAADEVMTKVTILREEFLHLHRYNPIEHVKSRVKAPESILDKVVKRGLDPSFESIRAHITDIAGIRITCSFIADTYRILDALTSQDDVRVIQVKDYIAHPKPNGYKSLHAIIEVPVFLSTGAVPVAVEVQIRTIAMDFWASLEHKIFYKYDGDVPAHLAADLAAAAAVAEHLDRRMEQLHTQVHGDTSSPTEETTAPGVDDALLRRLWSLARRGQEPSEA